MPNSAPAGMPPYIIIDYPVPGKVRRCYYNPRTEEYDICEIIDEDDIHKRIMTESRRAWGAIRKYS